MLTLYRPLPPKLRLALLISGLAGTFVLIMYLGIEGVAIEELLAVGLFLMIFILGVYFQR